MSPIPVEELRSRRAGPRPPQEGSLPARALEFLREHPKDAWRPKEIAWALDVEQTTLSPTLTRLRRKGLVDQIDGLWFALSDREVAKRYAAEAATRRANEK